MQMPDPSPLAVLGWVTRAKALAHKGYDAEEWLIARGAPPRALSLLRKSPVGGGAAGELGGGLLGIAEWMNAMRTASVFYRILNDNAFVRLPVYTKVGISILPVSGSAVGEAHAIPLSPLRLTNVRLTPVKAAALLVVTDELLANVGAAGQLALNQALQGAMADAVDAAFFDLIYNTGTLSIASSGPTAANAKHDLQTALLATNAVGAAQLYWIAGKDVARRAATLATTTGADAFPEMSPTAGTMAGLPMMVASGIPPTTLLLVDAAGIAADAGAVTVDVSGESDVLMADNPSMTSGTPTPAQMVNMFVTNSSAIRARAWIAAEPLREDAIAVIENIAWGGA